MSTYLAPAARFFGTVGLIAALFGAPAFALAQYYPYQTPYYNNNYNCSNYAYNYNNYPYNYSYNYNDPCQPNLYVYIYVNNYGTSNRTAPDFSISVSGNAYPSTLPGSLNGARVHVDGSYSVSVAQFSGFTPSYGSGCTGTVASGQQATCIVTENAIGYTPYPNQTYPYQTYQNYTYSNYTYPANQYYTQPAAVYVSPTYIPRLPNTGFEPITMAEIAFALAALIAGAIIALPYVRKAFAALLG